MAMYLLTVNGMKQNLLNLFLVKQDCLVIKDWCANQQYINGLM
jgi:hypothetical protein